MRRPRMTKRWWMVLVLAVALAMVCGRWGWRMSRVYGQKAAYHDAQEWNARLTLRMVQNPPPSSTRLQRLDSGRIMSALASLPGSKDLLAVWRGPLIEEQSPTALQHARREAEKWEELVIYHLQMRRKYERAAWFPWLPVGSDPPEPKCNGRSIVETFHSGLGPAEKVCPASVGTRLETSSRSRVLPCACPGSTFGR